MPNIPAITGLADGDAQDIETVYLAPTTGGVYWPGNKDTFEVLHGGCDEANLQGRVPVAAIQTGALACGNTIPFGDYDYIYAAQLPSGADTEKLVAPRLALDIELPWDASVVFLSYQVFAQHDATLWQAGSGSPEEERWTLEGKVDGIAGIPGLTSILPPGRGTTEASATVSTYPPGFHSEGRWRWSTGLILMKDLAKGKHTFEVTAKAQIFADDPEKAKLGMACGSVTWFALR